jgi:putative hydrolase of the HAD superfamily
MIKGILMDLGGTVYENKNYSFDAIIDKVYELNKNNTVSKKKFLEINKHLKKITYDNRKENEIRFLDYLHYLQDYCDLVFSKSLEEIEVEVVLSTVDTEIIDGIIDVLKYCMESNIKVVAVSNSMFSKIVILKQLELLNLTPYFYKILVSSEYLFRKPSHVFFELAIKIIDLKIEEILFVGNDYKCDVIGPNELGIKSCWFNINKEVNYRRVDTLEIHNYKRLIKYLKAE